MTKWKPSSRYRELIDLINMLLEDEKRIVRDIYYALEARGYHYSYKEVKYACKKGRTCEKENGEWFINPSQILDISRDAGKFEPAGWDEPQAYLNYMRNYAHTTYLENFWGDQPHYIEVWLEKVGLASILEPFCVEYNVRLIPCRGDQSITEIFEASLRFLKRLYNPDTGKLRIGEDMKKCIVLYFGDFNPSGLHAPVAIQKTMQKFYVQQNRPETEESFFEIDTGGMVKFVRVALTLDQLKKFPELPENPTPSKTNKDRKLRDRFMKYASGGRDVDIELNALKEFHREYFEEIIEESIKKYLDEDAWKEHKEKVKGIRKKLKDKIHIDDWSDEEVKS